MVEVKKGDVKPGEEVLVTWRAVPKDVNGPWTVYYYPARRWLPISPSERRRELRLDLVERQGRRYQSPDTRDLPTTPGETVGAGDLSLTPQTPL